MSITPCEHLSQAICTAAGRQGARNLNQIQPPSILTSGLLQILQ